MQAIKTFGLVLFIGGFILFNGIFFLSTYRLTTEIIRAKMNDQEKQELFISKSKESLSHDYGNSFEYVVMLDQTFEAINKDQILKFSINENEINQLTGKGKTKLDQAALESVFSPENETNLFKRKTFNDWGGYLIGQSATSDQIKDVAQKINQYAIVSNVGFDRYVVKDLKSSLTKASSVGPVKNQPLTFLFLTIGLCVIGGLLYILPKLNLAPGIKNNGIFHNVMKNTGWLGILTGTWLIVFYILLYFYPEYMTNWIIMVDPVSLVLNGNEASRFFLYGLMYTLCILVMGVRMLIHYRHSKYQMLRTVSVMFFQTAFAFLIPEILIRLNQPYFDFKNIWPLDYDFFFDSELDKLISSGTIGIFMLGWGIALIIIAVPVFVYFFGKRWYCSWVCGCGGLAETLGDPYRQLSNKTLKAWKVERWMIHGVLAFSVLMTAAVLYTYWTGASWFIFVDSYQLRSIYGAWIGAGFAGVVGTGFYPIMGNRVWCRFGCPLAAYLGLIQRFKSRFRITTNGGQCISCGNCSTYCEMGIDVRWYAQRGENIVRSSCVGCGVCSSVCPRGVLNLEVKDEKGRFGEPILIGNNITKINH